MSGPANATQDTSTDDLHEVYRILRDEMTRVMHWRRVIRARIDLSVTAVLLPDRLGTETTGVLPPECAQLLPDHDELARVARGTATPSEVLSLASLRALERRLTAYTDTIRRNLEYTTERLVLRAGHEPNQRVCTLRAHHEAE